MSLDKAIEHHKEKRQMYRGSKAIDCTCRNHGSCEWCRQNRQHKFRDKEKDAMRKVITYVADDGEEFSTKEQCWAYEHRFDNALDAVMFLDDDFNVIPFNLERVYESFQYIVIKDAEKAHDLFWAIYNWESCFVIPKDYKNGDILSWNGDHETYDFLCEERRKLNEKIDRIEKAVNAV